jgi:hypothetical protein
MGFFDFLKPIEKTVVKPIEWTVNEFNPISTNGGLHIKTPEFVDDLASVTKTIEKDIAKIGDGFNTAGHWVANEAIAIERGTVKFAEGAYDVGHSIFRVLDGTLNFVEKYYMYMLIGGGIYSASKVYNEVKKTNLI